MSATRTRALDLVVEQVRGLPGARALCSSFVPGEHGPTRLPPPHGLVETGDAEGGEDVIRLEL